MKKETVKRYMRRPYDKILIIALLLMFAIAATVYTGHAYADDEAKKESSENEQAAEALREVHKVVVEDKQYCLFVQHYVVLKPDEIQKMSDDELSAEILKRAGLYMKETNCKKEEHKLITTDNWKKSGGSFALGAGDIADIRAADPIDGSPVKLPMDIEIRTASTSAGQSQRVYTTHKGTGPKLIFVAVATEKDAALGEDICKEEKSKEKPPAKQKQSGAGDGDIPSDGGDQEPEEVLPEYRTINMTDRSGGPVEDTLKDGTPVSLKWIDPDEDINGGKIKSAFHSIPPIARWLIAIAAVMAALLTIVLLAARRRREDPSDQ